MLGGGNGIPQLAARIDAVPFSPVTSVWRWTTENATATIEHTNSGHPAWPADPDLAIKDGDGTKIAYHEVSQYYPDDPAYQSSTLGRNRSSTPGAFPLSAGNSIYNKIWFDLDDLPQNCTIENAVLGLTMASNLDASATVISGAATGMRAILDMVPGNEDWLAGDKWATDPHRREMTWNNRRHTQADGWPIWPLNDNARQEQFGLSCPPVNGTYVAGDHLSFDVTQAVQTYIDNRRDGAVNAGFWIICDAVAAAYWTFYLDRFSVANSDKNPFLSVTWNTRPHASPWRNKAVPFCFTSDDQVDSSHNAWFAILSNQSVPMTVFVRGDAIQGFDNGYDGEFLDIGGNRPTPEELRLWVESGAGGNEITCHSLRHFADNGITVNATEALVDIDVGRAWLRDDVLGGVCGDCDTFAYPTGRFNIACQKRLVSAGYWSARGVGDGTGVPTYDLVTPGYNNPGYGEDFADPADFLRWNQVSNLFAVACHSSDELVGFTTDDPQPDAADVKRTVYGLINLRIADGNSMFVTYAHDQKVQDFYPNGFDADELLYICQLVNSLKIVWPATYREAIKAYRIAHVPAPPPSGSVAESVGVTTGDSIWWDLP